MCKKINICIITRDMVIGGAERFITHLINFIDKNSFNVQLIILDKNKEANLSPIKEIDSSNIFFNPYHKNDPRQIYWLGKQMKKSDINVSFILRADQISAITAFCFQLNNLIITERGGRIHRFNNGLKKTAGILLDKFFVYPVSKFGISNSQEGKRALSRSGMAKDKILVIPNGIFLRNDIDINSPHEDNIGFIGRLVPAKNVDVVIRGFYHYIKHRLDKNTNLLIAGDGPERSYLENLVTELKINDRVKFLGEIHDLDQFYKKIFAGIIASETESFPNVLLEYWNYKVPVICSNIQSFKDLCIDRKSALFFDLENDISLSNMIYELVTSKGLRTRIIKNAHDELVRKYEIFSVVNRYEEVLRKCSQTC